MKRKKMFEIKKSENLKIVCVNGKQELFADIVLSIDGRKTKAKLQCNILDYCVTLEDETKPKEEVMDGQCTLFETN